MPSSKTFPPPARPVAECPHTRPSVPDPLKWKSAPYFPHFAGEPKNDATDAGHGRIERRTTHVCPAAGDPVTIGLPHARAVLRIRRERQPQNPDAPAPKTEPFFYIASQDPDARTLEGWAKLARRHWGVENANHWRRDVCLLEALKTYRGKQRNICAAFLPARTVLLALNADWGTGNLNALLEELRACPTAVWGLAVRGTTTCRRIARRTAPLKSSSK